MKSPTRFNKKRLRFDSVIQHFFGGSAAVAVLVLALIMVFLFREGAGFFPQNLENLRIYRLAGLEYVDFMRAEVEAHTAINRALQALRLKQLKVLLAQNKNDVAAANKALAQFDQFTSEFDDAVQDVRGYTSDLNDTVTAIKEKARVRSDVIQQRQFLLAAGKTAEARKLVVAGIDFEKEVAPVRATFPVFQKANFAFRAKLESLLVGAPSLPVPSLEPQFEKIQTAIRTYISTFPQTERKLKTWKQFAPVPWYRSITSFLFGTEWITNSFWQDWYGVLPLLAGSLLVSFIAMLIAVPLGVASAIYVSELATAAEQKLIKPYLEFISAIPSVVIGFFGIEVLGDRLRDLTHWHALQWIPFFPISERLNAFTAGSLLALMAIPTIFSLAEDALNTVPQAFREASYALGATRVQTIFRVLIPSALSGIVSAVLLGFGRVIGETMVVLLCAGNRIAIPDFSVGAFFQPVHTMTGIIAQEMGEVVRDSIHYRALFVVGLLLFLLSLIINGLAQAAVRRFKISIG